MSVFPQGIERRQTLRGLDCAFARAGFGLHIGELVQNLGLKGCKTPAFLGGKPFGERLRRDVQSGEKLAAIEGSCCFEVRRLLGICQLHELHDVDIDMAGQVETDRSGLGNERLVGVRTEGGTGSDIRHCRKLRRACSVPRSAHKRAASWSRGSSRAACMAR